MSPSRTAVKRDEGGKSLTHDPRRLKRRRVAAGLSMTELALLAKCSKASVSMLESGRYFSATPGLLARLARALSCEITDLIPDEDAA